MIRKVKTNGFWVIFKVMFKRLLIIISAPIARLGNYEQLKKNGYLVNFVHEANTIVKLPRLSILEVLFNKGPFVKKTFDFAARPNAESLLRKTIFELYNSGYINHELSIVDIGCWISDNTIVWARYLTGKGIVFAIDPSSDNLKFGKAVAEKNDVQNIKWIEAVCAEKPGIKLDFDGSIDHANFKEVTTNHVFESSTVDDIVQKEGLDIGLLHVDVEGFELSVLKGATVIIKRNKPIILFEQHISKEDFESISIYIKKFGYRIFMINEVLPGCELDCRNFLAVPSEKDLPKLINFKQSNARNMGIYSAVIGASLIEV
jgi:FkbM family methyltransferase